MTRISCEEAMFKISEKITIMICILSKMKETKNYKLDEKLLKRLFNYTHEIKCCLSLLSINDFEKTMVKVELLLVENKNKNKENITFEVAEEILTVLNYILKKISSFKFVGAASSSVELVSLSQVSDNRKEASDLEYVFIGNNNNFYSELSTRTSKITNLKSINEVYENFSILDKVNQIILDTSTLDVNPFLLQEVISKITNKIKFIYLYDQKDILVKNILEAGELHFKFIAISINSKFLIKEIMKESIL